MKLRVKSSFPLELSLCLYVFIIITIIIIIPGVSFPVGSHSHGVLAFFCVPQTSSSLAKPGQKWVLLPMDISCQDGSVGRLTLWALESPTQSYSSSSSSPRPFD